MPQPFTRIPGAGSEVCGLIGLRGRVVTVFDLCALLGDGRLDPGRDFRILVVKAADRVVGLAVGDIATVAEGEAVAATDRGSGPGESMEPDLDRLIRAKLA